MTSQKNNTQEDPNIDIENTEDQKEPMTLSPELERIQELETLLSKSEKEKDEKTDQLLRIAADMQNMKRRADAERSKLRQDGAVTILRPMVTLLDNLSRAFAHIPEDLQGNEFIDSLAEIEKNFQKTLSDEGVSFFTETGDSFNAELHESMMLDPNADEGTIAQVFEKGVLYKDQVIRHAKVSVGGKI